jgi:DNA-binding CsgD family transcriptional regulator
VLAQLSQDDDRREVLEAGLATVSFLLVRPAEVERIAGRLAVSARDPGRAAEMAWLVAYSRMRTGHLAQADSVIEAALTRLGIGQGAARLIALRSMILALLCRFDESERTADEALAAAEKSGDRLAAGYARHSKTVLRVGERDTEAALDQADRALAVIGDDPQATDLRVLVLANRISLVSDMDRWEEATDQAREAVALAEQAGTPRVGNARYALGYQYFVGGQWDDALAELEPIARMPAPIYLQLLAYGVISLIAGHRDDSQTAQEYLDRITEEAMDHAVALGNVHNALLARAMAAERAGRTNEAARILASAALDHGPSETLPGRFLLLLPLARLRLAAGDTATAARAAAAAREEAGIDPLPMKVAIADHCGGLVAGDSAAIMATARYYQTTGRMPERAMALEDAGQLMAARGDMTSARQVLASAVNLYQELGAVWDVRRADARLRQHGIRRARGGARRRPQTGWASLTPTETKVACLVAEGRSNPDIAAHLLLSRNTVQTHVSHILTKLGARSRGEIIRPATGRPGSPPDRRSGPRG